MLPECIGNREHVFIAAAAHIHDDESVFAKLFGEVIGAGQGVARFERGEDAFEPRAFLEPVQGFIIRGADIFRASYIVEVSMFWPDTGIV